MVLRKYEVFYHLCSALAKKSVAKDHIMWFHWNDMSRKSKCTVIEIERLQSGLCTPGSPAGGVGERGVQMGGAAGRGTARLWTLKSEDPSSACPPHPPTLGTAHCGLWWDWETEYWTTLCWCLVSVRTWNLEKGSPAFFWSRLPVVRPWISYFTFLHLHFLICYTR